MILITLSFSEKEGLILELKSCTAEHLPLLNGYHFLLKELNPGKDVKLLKAVKELKPGQFLATVSGSRIVNLVEGDHHFLADNNHSSVLERSIFMDPLLGAFKLKSVANASIL